MEDIDKYAKPCKCNKCIVKWEHPPFIISPITLEIAKINFTKKEIICTKFSTKDNLSLFFFFEYTKLYKKIAMYRKKEVGKCITWQRGLGIVPSN